MLPHSSKRVLLTTLALVLLLITGCRASIQAASGPGAPAAPIIGAAQDTYPLPPPPPTHDPYAGPPPPPQPTLDPYAGPPDPTAPQPPPSPLPDRTATPPLRPTHTATPVPGATVTAPAAPGVTPTVAPPGTLTPLTPTPIGAVTATPGVPTPIPAPDSYPEAAVVPTLWLAPTPDHAARLISTAVAREQAAAATSAPIQGADSPRYGGFVAVTAVLLAGIGYAALLRRQRARDRAALWGEQHPDE